MSSGLKEMSFEEAKRRVSKGKTASSSTTSSANTGSRPVEAAVIMPPPSKFPRLSDPVPVDDLELSFPPTFLAKEDVEEGMWPHAEKLLFPTARQRFNNLSPEVVLGHVAGQSLQALQGTLAARSFVKGFNAKHAQALLKVDNLTTENELLRTQQAELKSKLEEDFTCILEEREKELEGKNEELLNKNKKVEQELEDLREESRDVAAFSLTRGRAMIACEVYHKGATAKDCQAVVDEYLEHFGSLADLLIASFELDDAAPPGDAASLAGEGEAATVGETPTPVVVLPPDESQAEGVLEPANEEA